MKFTAYIKQGSTIDRAWKNHHRVGGVLHGTRFVKAGALFVASGEIHPQNMQYLCENPNVQVEAMSWAPADIDILDTVVSRETPPKNKGGRPRKVVDARAAS